MTAQQFSREYKSIHHAQRDMKHQASRGYEVVSVTDIPQSAGILRWLTLGFAALVFKPRPHVLVVYRLSAGQTFQVMGERGYPELVRVAPPISPMPAMPAMPAMPISTAGQMTTAENLAVLKRIPQNFIDGCLTAKTEASRMWHALTTKFER